MDNSNISLKKTLEKNISKKHSFEIKKKKTFLSNKKINFPPKSESTKKAHSLKNISSFPIQKNIKQKKSKCSTKLLLMNINNAEEEIRNAIIEMKNDCLLELKNQNYDLNYQQNNKKKRISN